MSPDEAKVGTGRQKLWIALVAIVATVLVVGWLAGSLGFFAIDQAPAPASVESISAFETPGRQDHRIAELTELPPGTADHVEVAYFHRTQRCWSCTEAERLTRKALDDHYADEVAAGRITLHVADVEDPANADFAAKYDAWGSSLYLGITIAGTTYVYPVKDIWFSINDEDLYLTSLKDKIALSLGDS